MSIPEGLKELLLPKDVQAKYKVSERKLRRLSQLGVVPSIPTGTRKDKDERGPQLRLYDEAVLDQLDPAIWKSDGLKRGVKPAGQQHRYYSVRRRKAK